MTDSSHRTLIDIYRHDAHKLHGTPHDAAADTFAGVPVNRPVPYGADGDAAALSRPSGQPEQTLDTHATPYRLSLLTGESQYDPTEATPTASASATRRLLTDDDPTAVHRAWLDSDVVSAFNESVYYPYTSLKYHTLLVAALFDNYREGHAFPDLYLVVDPADEVIPHQTIYLGDEFALRLTSKHGDRPSSRLGAQPSRSWAAVWGRLTAHPIDTDGDAWARVLDANLRRIRSWSTALQYLEDFAAWRSEHGDSNHPR